MAITRIGALVHGLAAGVAGTAAMTAWQEASAKLQGSGEDGSGEDPGSDPWEDAPVPAQVGRKIMEGGLGVEVPPERIPLLTNVMHWGYGTAWGAVYGLMRRRGARTPIRHGLAFGTAVWAASYAQLVPMGLYEPPWKYPPKQLALDLSYHLAYGAGLGSAHALVQR